MPKEELSRLLLSTSLNNTNATNEPSSLDFDLNIDYRYMPDGVYIGMVVIAVTSCLLSMAGSTCILYFLLISHPRNGNKQHSPALQPSQELTTNSKSQEFDGRRKSERTSISSVRQTLAKLGLYHRLLVGLSITDWITALIVAVQPILLPASTQYFFAIGNTATCRLAGFWILFFNGSYLYSAALSLYFYLTIRRGKTEKEASAIMEPYSHIIAIAFPLIASVLAIAFDMFHPQVFIATCFVVAPQFRAECVTSTPEQQKALGLSCSADLKQELVSLIPALIVVVSVVVGITATFLVYWTFRQQTLRSHRLSFGSEGQAHRTRAVGRQAVLYMLAFLLAIFDNIYCVLIPYISDRKIGDPADMYGSVFLYVSIYFVYAIYPLQGFLNCIIFMRPRVIKWQEAEPDQSWFWCYRRVLSGYPPPTRRQQKVADRLGSGGRAAGQPHSSSNSSNHQYMDSGGSMSLTLPSAALSPSPMRLVETDLCVDSAATTSEVVANAQASEEFEDEQRKNTNLTFNEPTDSSIKEASTVAQPSCRDAGEAVQPSCDNAGEIVTPSCDDAGAENKRIDTISAALHGEDEDHSISHHDDSHGAEESEKRKEHVFNGSLQRLGDRLFPRLARGLSHASVSSEPIQQNNRLDVSFTSREVS